LTHTRALLVLYEGMKLAGAEQVIIGEINCVLLRAIHL